MLLSGAVAELSELAALLLELLPHAAMMLSMAMVTKYFFKLLIFDGYKKFDQTNVSTPKKKNNYLLCRIPQR